MSIEKIEVTEYQHKLVSSLPDRPNSTVAHGGRAYTAKQMKEAIDQLPIFLINKYNELVYAITAAAKEGSIADQMHTGIYVDGEPYTLSDLLKDMSNGVVRKSDGSVITIGEHADHADTASAAPHTAGDVIGNEDDGSEAGNMFKFRNTTGFGTTEPTNTGYFKLWSILHSGTAGEEGAVYRTALVPSTNGQQQLGKDDRKFKSVHAIDFCGNLRGTLNGASVTDTPTENGNGIFTAGGAYALAQSLRGTLDNTHTAQIAAAKSEAIESAKTYADGAFVRSVSFDSATGVLSFLIGSNTVSIDLPTEFVSGSIKSITPIDSTDPENGTSYDKLRIVSNEGNIYDIPLSALFGSALTDTPIENGKGIFTAGGAYTMQQALMAYARSLDHSEVVSPVLTEASDGRLSLLALADRNTYITRGLYDADAWYLEITLPTDLTVSSAFDCILTLPVGAVGLQVTAPANIKWQGDNVVSGAFCPTVNTVHDIYLRWNGYNYTATVTVSDWEETSSE